MKVCPKCARPPEPTCQYVACPQVPRNYVRTLHSSDTERLERIARSVLSKPHIVIWNGRWMVYPCGDRAMDMKAYSFANRANWPKW